MVVIVTGSSSGIGKAIALACGKEGGRVVVNGRDEKRTTDVAEDIRKSGGRAIHVLADVSRESEVRRIIDTALREYGRVDVLVNCALQPPSHTPILERDFSEIQAEVATTFLGTVLCCRAVIPHMLGRKTGRIVNITSNSMKLCPPGLAIYAACKAGVAAFSRSMALELATQGITVNCVAPGLTDTPPARKAFEESPELEKQYVSMIPMLRMGRPEEIASMVVYLASEEAKYITGQNYSVDGGLTW